MLLPTCTHTSTFLQMLLSSLKWEWDHGEDCPFPKKPLELNKGTKAKVVRDKTSLQNNQKPSFFQQLLTSVKSAKCCFYCAVPSSFFVILIYFEKMMKCLLCCHHVVCIFRFTHLWKRSVSRECYCFLLHAGWHHRQNYAFTHYQLSVGIGNTWRRNEFHFVPLP